MVLSEIFFTKQNTAEFKKDITSEEVKKIIQELGLRFNIDLMDIVKKVASKHADGFSLNKNNPYVHLYVGNGSENITIELMTLEKETKIKVPKSFFLV